MAPPPTAASEARRALARLRRAVAKAERELSAVAGALRSVEGVDFPSDEYGDAHEALARVTALADAEGARLQAKILEAGGLEPGRIRRGGGIRR